MPADEVAGGARRVRGVQKRPRLKPLPARAAKQAFPGVRGPSTRAATPGAGLEEAEAGEQREDAAGE